MADYSAKKDISCDEECLTGNGNHQPSPSSAAASSYIEGKGSPSNKQQDRASTQPLHEHQYRLSQQQELEFYRAFAKDLFSVISHPETGTVARLVDLIRSGASNQDIHDIIGEIQSAQLRNPDLDDAQ
ncbi:uncharacterized protein N7529_009714 [Penicillium soppii]|uniref:uncharacterized protein n=1 Tax=Penicillium soppii TaxID=69789 RepID=UPI002548F010|nr:uncharacterized protein N7529_009714 [Penicillium soppii]KAJ5855770.1 hypothetical protein N7529_009714 [Penicillium soppii]